MSTKSSHLLEQTYIFQLLACLSTCDLLVDTRIRSVKRYMNNSHFAQNKRCRHQTFSKLNSKFTWPTSIQVTLLVILNKLTILFHCCFVDIEHSFQLVDIVLQYKLIDDWCKPVSCYLEFYNIDLEIIKLIKLYKLFTFVFMYSIYCKESSKSKRSEETSGGVI